MHNQRKSVRLKTRHEARVRFSPEVVVACEIHDFCQTGFFLHLSEQNAVSILGPSLTQSNVTVEFAAGGAGGQAFKVMGRVAHYSRTGLGIFAESLSAEAFQALLTNRSAHKGAAAEAGDDDLGTVDARTIRDQCLSLYQPFLGRVISEFFSLAQKRGDEEYVSGSSLAYQSPILTALGEIKPHHERIQRNFIDAALGRVRQHEAPEAEPTPNHKAIPFSEASLTLVEEEEFEDWLNLSAAISKLEDRFRENLLPFERLYRLLRIRVHEMEEAAADAPDDAGQTSPFSPAALCGAFQEALEGLRLNKAQRTFFFQVFGQAVASVGDEFYEGLRKITAVAERRHSRSGAKGRASDRPTGSDAMDYSLDRTLEALNQFEPASALPSEEAMRHAQAATAPGGPPATPPRESNLLHTTDILLQAVNQLVQHVPNFPPPYALTPPRAIQPGQRPAGANELLLALDTLIQARQGSRPPNWQPSLTVQLREHLDKADGSAISITPRQQQTLDSLAGLFDNVMREYTPSSELEALIKRFEPLFFKLAFQDPEFLTSASHPARQVINLLDKFAIACDDAGKFFDPKLPKALTFLVENTLAKADQEPGIFHTAAQTLEKMLQPLQKVRERRIHRLQEMCEGKGRILQARSRVMHELVRLLGGREVPRILLRLLDAGWRHYLSLLELRQGVHGEDWQISLGVVEQLQAWLSPGFEPPADFASRARELMRELRRRMTTLCVDPLQMNDLLGELDSLLASRTQDPGAKVDVQYLEPDRLLRGLDDEGGELPEDSRLRHQLVLGSWWNVTGEGGKPATMQLIWLSQPPGSCALANRSATKKLDLSLGELAGKLETGQAEPASDKEMALLERSEGSLIDVVYKQMATQATRDPVTYLLNHRGFIQKIREMASNHPPQGRPHSLCVIEFDRLRVISLQHGPEARDQLLRELAKEAQHRLRPNDLLGVLRDDGLAAYLPDCDAEEGQRVLNGFIDWLSNYRFGSETGGYSVGASVGLVEFMPGELEPEEILRRADAACMRSASLGRNQVQRYGADDDAMKDQASLMEWAGRIDQILDGEGLYLRCQLVSPIQANTELKPYYEILLGVRGADGSNISPQQFILAVERWNRVHDIDRWVIAGTLNWIRHNPDTFAAIGGFSVNLSAQSLNNEMLLAYLHQELATPDLPVEKIIFEITETGTIGSYAAAQEFIQQIRHYGCKFSIDDFGSGFASYGHLKNLQTDTLKIDGLFVKDMLNSPADYAMVKSMREIGHSLGMRVVAEFVATPQILEAVREIGVDYAQGYALHQPMPLADLPSMLATAPT